MKQYDKWDEVKKNTDDMKIKLQALTQRLKAYWVS